MKLFKLTFLALIGLSVALTSCNENNITPSESASGLTFAATTHDSLKTHSDSAKAHSDSIRNKHTSTVHVTKKGKYSTLVPIVVSTLPSTITTYITTNYAGSTINKAAQDTLNNYYILIKKADNTHVGLVFDSAGTFVKVIEKTTTKGTAIDVSTLLAVITDYVAANYTGAIIEFAIKDAKGNYHLMVKKTDGTQLGLNFNSAGKFLNVMTLKNK